MNRETTQKLTSRSSTDPDAANTKWQTPPEVFAKLSADFGPFDMDMTADASNHLLPYWIGPGSPVCEDILVALDFPLPHSIQDAKGYSNPTYDYHFLNLFVPACSYACRKGGFASTLLLPNRTNSDWWRYLIEHQRTEEAAAKILWCDKRICFYEGGEPRWNVEARKKEKWRADSAVFDSIIVHFSPGYLEDTQFGMWEVPPHVPKIYREIL
jgi:hypothetical protein